MERMFARVGRALTKPREAGIVACLAATALFVTCADEPPMAPGADLGTEANMLPMSGPGAINVTVRNQSGTPLGENYRVTVLNEHIEPRVALTNIHGVAPFPDLPLGSYCVHAVPGALPATDRIFPPAKVFDGTASGFNPAHIPSEGAAAVTEKLVTTGPPAQRGWHSVALTEANFFTYCVDSPPVVLTASEPAIDVDVKLQNFGSVVVAFKDPGGNVVPTPAAVLIDLEHRRQDLPASWTAGIPDDAHPGLLLALNRTSTQGHNLNVPLGLQNLLTESAFFLGHPPGPPLFAEKKDHAGPNSEVDLGTLQAEVNMCKLEKSTEIDPPISTSRVHFLASNDTPIKDGWQSSTEMTLNNAVAIWYWQEGNGEATLKMRFDGNDGSLQINYECTDGSCQVLSRSGSSALPVTWSFAHEEGTDTRVLVTWSITGLVNTTQLVDYQLEAAGAKRNAPNHKWPSPSRDEFPRGWKPIANVLGACDPLSANDQRIFQL